MASDEQKKRRAYKYKVMPAGPVSVAQWSGMSTCEKLDTFKQVLGISTDARAAAMLGVHVQLIKMYRSGDRNMGPITDAKMAKFCVEDTQLPIKEYMAVNTIAVDPALDVFDKALAGDGLLSLNMSCYALALKIAALSERVIDRVVVPQLVTCYGSTPAFVLVKIAVPGTPILVEIKVTYAIDPHRFYLARTNILEDGNVKQVFAHTMSDRAVEEILIRINKYIERYERRKVTERHNEGVGRKPGKSQSSRGR